MLRVGFEVKVALVTFYTGMKNLFVTAAILIHPVTVDATEQEEQTVDALLLVQETDSNCVMKGRHSTIRLDF